MQPLEHPNVALVKQLNPNNPAEAGELFAPSFVWHYFNPRLPDLEGDYVGLNGLRSFFRKLGSLSGGTFRVAPISLVPFGDELLVAHVTDNLTLDGERVRTEAVVVWRIVDGCIAEAWDIPAVHAVHCRSKRRRPSRNPIP